jgi:hypothetical protein
VAKFQFRLSFITIYISKNIKVVLFLFLFIFGALEFYLFNAFRGAFAGTIGAQLLTFE